MRWGRYASAALGLALFAMVAACSGGDDDVVDSEGVLTTTVPRVFEATAVIESIDRALDDLHLEVTVSQVPTGATPECEVRVIDRSKEYDTGAEPPIRPKVVLARADGAPVSYEEGGPGPWPECEAGTQQVVVELAHPHSGRNVIVDHPVYSLWVPTGDGTYQRCELPGCDPQTGQPPDPAGCDHTLVDAVRAGDVPKRSGIDVRGCAGGYAVVDIDIGASACPASGDEPNPCAGKRIDRTFWATRYGTWTLITFGLRDVPGCADAELPPEFPRDLCEGLPPAVP